MTYTNSILFKRHALSFLTILCVFCLPPAFAQSITGEDGNNGANAPAGEPPADGTDGQAGESLTQSVIGAADLEDSYYLETRSQLVGGNGGIGGKGGDATGGDLDGGAGGNGGDGGDTYATTDVLSEGDSRAYSDGGDGGNGRAGGEGFGTGTTGASGDGGDGGDGYASATRTSATDEGNRNTTYASGDGGDGGDSLGLTGGGNGGDGGFGWAEVESATINYASATATGGDGGGAGNGTAGNGGDGFARGVTYNSRVTARGGSGGKATTGVAGDGGDGYAVIGPVGSPLGTTLGTANAIGGAGGSTSFGQAGNGGNAEAYGTSAGATGGAAGDSTVGQAGLAGDALALSNTTVVGESSIGLATALGGEGGDSRGVANYATDGGTATATQITHRGGGAHANGGVGGKGYNGAAAGNGGDSEANYVCDNCNYAGEYYSNVADAGLIEQQYDYGPHRSPWEDVQTHAKGGSLHNGSGQAAGTGGNATANATILSTDGSINAGGARQVTSSAYAGFGGDVVSGYGNGGDGGAANANTFLTDTTDTDADVDKYLTAIARGGDGGLGRGAGNRGGDGGRATVDARVTDLGNNNGLVSFDNTAMGGHGGAGLAGADGGAGGDSILLNTFTTEGGEHLRLTQKAIAGRGGNSSGGTAGDGGDAWSEIDHTDLTVNYLEGTVEAYGAQGGFGLDGGTDGADGSVGGRISLTGSNNVDATAIIRTGNGRSVSGAGNRGGDGVDASYINQILAEAISTNGGDVEANVVVNEDYFDNNPDYSLPTGQAGNGNAGADGGDGGDTTLINTVDGQTNGGSIWLSQTANGTSGGAVELGNNGGDGGDGYSELNRSYDTAGAAVGKAYANGAKGGTVNDDFGFMGDAGSADARSTMHNAGGAASAITEARGAGQTGTNSGTQMGETGDAFARSQASSEGDNADATATSYARGGGSGSASDAIATGGTTDGGAAAAIAIAASEGNSAAKATATSYGGYSGYVWSGEEGATAGWHGQADATATATNIGTGLVEATAKAENGSIGDRDYARFPRPSKFQNITATATGTGNGETNVSSSAGRSTLGTGLATATSTATGASGNATSTAYTNINLFRDQDVTGVQDYVDPTYSVRAQATAGVNGVSNTQAQIGHRNDLDTVQWDKSKQAQAFMMATPDQEAVEQRMVGADTSESLFGSAINDDAEYLAYSKVGATHSGGAGGLETVSFSNIMVLDQHLIDDPKNFLLAFIGAESIGNGFDALSFVVEGRTYEGGNDLEEIFSIDFTDVAAAMAFFSDRVLNLGSISDLPTHRYPHDPENHAWSQIFFNIDITTAAAGDGFALDMVAANANVVPVPPAVWLFGSALGVLGWMRKKAGAGH